MNLVEIIGNQHLRVLALEEELGRVQAENSKLQEKVMKLTPAEKTDDGEAVPVSKPAAG